MSYADAAKKGPKQSPEEARAPDLPSIEHEDEPASLIDVDSPHIQSVESDFKDAAVKTETQADRLEAEGSDEAKAVRDKAVAAASDAKKKASAKGKEAKKEAKKEWASLKENSDNPVVVGNAIIWAVGAAAIGFGAYKKHTEGQLDLKLAGLTAGAVAAFAAADYYGSQWLFENKYPKK